MSDSKPNARILDRLFPKIGSELFVRKYFGHEPMFSTGDRSRFELDEDKALFSPASLFEKGVAIGTAQNGYLRRPNGESYHLKIQPEGAKALYDFGGTVEVADVLGAFPHLKSFVNTLKSELGAQLANAVILVSPPGEALPTHFDQRDVFILQLVGRKRWRVTRNDSVEFPLDSYFPNVTGEGRDDAVWPKYFPSAMPRQIATSETSDVILESGSVAYVPRGWWHETEALETSISITVLCSPSNFVDLFLGELRKKLVLDPSMRRPVVLPFDKERRDRTSDEVASLVGRALELAKGLDPNALVSKPFVEQRFSRAPHATLAVLREGETQALAQVMSRGELVCEIEIEHESAGFCAWLSEQPLITGKQAVAAAEKNVERAESMLEALVDAGYYLRQ